jgi:hypothetical protein
VEAKEKLANLVTKVQKMAIRMHQYILEKAEEKVLGKELEKVEAKAMEMDLGKVLELVQVSQPIY